MIRSHDEPNGGVRFALNRERKERPNFLFCFSRLTVDAPSTGNNVGVREGVFECGSESLRCHLIDLPHNVETYTTTDRVNYYKSADIGQV